MIELKEGKITNKDLAEWFGIKPMTLSKNKEKKLKELENFAEFYEDKGKIVITKVLNPIYTKQASKSKDIIFSAFDEEWSKTGLDTCSNVANKIYDKHKQDLSIVKTTTYNYTINVRNEKYGKPFMGQCYYLWCKKEVAANGAVVFTEFTEEEKRIKDKLIRKYFATDEEKDILIREMVEAGEITKEEAYDLSCEYRGLNQAGFMAFKAELEEALKCKIVKGTMIKKEEEKMLFC